MPIHLPPFSRRQFLTRSLVAGAGLALNRSLFAAEKPVDAHTWALLADTHIAADRTLIARETNMADNLARVGQELAALPKRMAGVLVNGDCAYNQGLPGDYQTFTALVEPVRQAQMPVHLTLGNHDDRANFRAGVREAREGQGTVTEKHAVILRTERANWFLLDTLEFVNKTPGWLGEQQLAWLAKALDANPGKPAILVAHHNLHLTSGENKGALKDTDQLLEIMRSRRQVKAYIFGHTHYWDVKEDSSGIHLINLPPVGYVFNKTHPNGWVEATVKPTGLRLKLHALKPDHPAHGQVKELTWRSA